jgi:hypothetical protein
MIKHTILTAVVFAALAGPASAGWITIKNDTDKVVVIQEVRVMNGKTVKGKVYRLTPGEVLKEFQTGPGEKTVLVSEKDGTPVKAKLTWGKDDAAFSVSKDGDDVKLASKSR